MRLLLTDGSGLTSRQVATQASAAGHHVEVLSPTRFGLASFTRHVERVHRVPAFGLDPDGWLEATLAVIEAGSHEVVMPTQEQVALLSRHAERVRVLGAALAVPSFESLRRVQHKVSQAETLAELGLPHPPTVIARSVEELIGQVRPPAYLKAPIGTASTGVRRVTAGSDILATARWFEDQGAFDDGGVVVQEPATGKLVMVQAVFADGRLVAWHANERVQEGINGGATVKRSLSVPVIGAHLEQLGEALGWTGALSLDAILTPTGPSYIDINPRLVEPGNAWRAGTDLVTALVAVSVGTPGPSRPAGDIGVTTHQLLLAVLRAAEQRGRRGVLRELLQALLHRGPYVDSSEELTPLRDDRVTAVPVATVIAATLVLPAAAQSLAEGGVAAYALTPAAWRQILS